MSDRNDFQIAYLSGQIAELEEFKNFMISQHPNLDKEFKDYKQKKKEEDCEECLQCCKITCGILIVIVFMLYLFLSWLAYHN